MTIAVNLGRKATKQTKSLNINFFDSLQVTEELEKVKMEMEDRGSSMTDGGKLYSFNH